jgi:hypothetical protein
MYTDEHGWNYVFPPRIYTDKSMIEVEGDLPDGTEKRWNFSRADRQAAPLLIHV